MFEEQVVELVKAGIRTVNLFFDNDIYGVSTTMNVFKLISTFTPIRVNVVIYPGGHWGSIPLTPIKQCDLKMRMIY